MARKIRQVALGAICLLVLMAATALAQVSNLGFDIIQQSMKSDERGYVFQLKLSPWVEVREQGAVSYYFTRDDKKEVVPRSKTCGAGKYKLDDWMVEIWGVGEATFIRELVVVKDGDSKTSKNKVTVRYNCPGRPSSNDREKRVCKGQADISPSDDSDVKKRQGHPTTPPPPTMISMSDKGVEDDEPAIVARIDLALSRTSVSTQGPLHILVPQHPNIEALLKAPRVDLSVTITGGTIDPRVTPNGLTVSKKAVEVKKLIKGESIKFDLSPQIGKGQYELRPKITFSLPEKLLKKLKKDNRLGKALSQQITIPLQTIRYELR
jgi:hypothetical protein